MSSMSKTISVRFTDEEEQVVQKAAKTEKQPGDRGGVSGWLRRIVLREAKKVVDEKEVR